MKILILVFCLALIGFSVESQIELPIDEYGVVKYSFDLNESNSKFCISKLFCAPNFSENQILNQKTNSIITGLSWNEGIQKNFSIFCSFSALSMKTLQCIDTAILNPGLINLRVSTHGNKKFKANITGENTSLNHIDIKLNCKIYFKSTTEYTINISDIYMVYAILKNGQTLSKRIEIGELYKEYQSSTSKDQNVEVLLQLLDNAAKNMANSLSKAVHESVVFLN